VPSYQYIDRQQELIDCCTKLRQQTVLAVDTEFVRERTFYPQPGLLQVSDGLNISLIDPNSEINLDVFFELLESPDIRIVMHSSSEDIELFNVMGCGKIENLFDTQIAASWLGMGQSLSLQKLIEHHENIIIQKQLSRTDWLKRPLSEAQLNYAAVDVLYLNAICTEQEAALKQSGFLANMLEDCAVRCESKSVEDNDRQAYLKVKRAITATDGALKRLQMIARWREQQARKDDKPRQHIIKDPQLLSISLLNPLSLEDLSKKCDLQSFVVRRYGESIMQVLTDADTISEPSHPVLSLRSLPGAGKTLNECRALMTEIHQQLDIPVEVLPSKRWLEQFLLHQAADWYPLPEGWKGWRKKLLANPLQQKIEANSFNQETLV